MHALAVDNSGNVALIDLEDISQHGWLRCVRGAKILETGEVLKDCDVFHRPTPDAALDMLSLPRAKPVWGYVKGSRERYGEKALKWKLGFKAQNGFCVPDLNVLEANYELLLEFEA
jgi:hypothetical protein